jgi:hypothetical protein
MKNLDKLANEIWEQKCPQKKRELIHQLIDYSSAKDKTKILAHAEVKRMPDWNLDSFTANYKLSGDGHKVIK